MQFQESHTGPDGYINPDSDIELTKETSDKRRLKKYFEGEWNAMSCL